MQLTVVTRTPRRLVLRLAPVRTVAYWGFGLLFIAMGLGAAWLLGRAVSFACERDAGATGTCTYASTTTLHTTRRTFPVSALQGAVVRFSDGGLVKSKLLVVRTDRGDLALHLSNATGAVKDSLAAQITAFAQGAAPAVLVREDNRTLGFLFGLFLVGSGVACIGVIERCVLVMDRDERVVRIRGLRHGWPRRVDIPLDRVHGVGMAAFTVRRARSFTVYFNLGDRVREPLTRAALFTDRSAERTVDLIQSWLEEAPR